MLHHAHVSLYKVARRARQTAGLALALSLLLGLLSSPALALPPHQAQYQVQWGDRHVGNLSVEAKQTEKQAVVVATLDAVGLANALMPGQRIITSTFNKTAQGLRQESVVAVKEKLIRFGRKRDKERLSTIETNRITYNHHNGTAIARDEEKTVTLTITPTTYDSQTLALLVADQWKAATPQQRKAGLAYDYVTDTELDRYVFKDYGEHQLDTAVGTLTVQKLATGKPDGKQNILWLAKDWDYFPVGFDKIKPERTPIITRISAIPIFSQRQ